MRYLDITGLCPEGFKSFTGDSTVLHFPKRSGLYFVTGNNELEPWKGANATGKTSLFDSLYWVLSSTTGKSTRGSVLKSWDNPSCKVMVDLYVGDGKDVSPKRETPGILRDEYYASQTRYTIRRSYEPNSLTLQAYTTEADPKPVSQEELESTLGFTAVSLETQVFFGQQATYFFDLKPAEKLKRVSEVLGLQYWEGVAKAAKGEANTAEVALTELKESLARLEGEQSAIASQVSGLQAQVQDYETERRKLSSRRAVVEAHLRREHTRAKVVYRAACQTEEDEQSQVAHWEAKGKKYTNAIAELVRGLDRLEFTETACTKTIAEDNGHIVELKEQHGRCSLCLRPLKDSDIDRAVGATRSRRGITEAEREHVRAHLVELGGELDTLKRKRVSASDRERAARTALSAARRGLEVARRAQESLERELAAVADSAAREARASNPHSDALARANAREGELGVQIAVALSKIGTVARQGHLATRAAKAFREVRLWVLTTALEELTLTTNNALLALGLREWEISFEVEQENASGGVTKGFLVSVRPPNQKKVRWESFSGSESQLLRIAGAVGLADLVSNRTGTVYSFEVWDEPTTGLSRELIDLLLDFLASRVTKHKSVYLIDHRNLSTYGGFAGSLTVLKDRNGSRIENNLAGRGEVVYSGRKPKAWEARQAKARLRAAWVFKE